MIVELPRHNSIYRGQKIDWWKLIRFARESFNNISIPLSLALWLQLIINAIASPVLFTSRSYQPKLPSLIRRIHFRRCRICSRRRFRSLHFIRRSRIRSSCARRVRRRHWWCSSWLHRLSFSIVLIISSSSSSAFIGRVNSSLRLQRTTTTTRKSSSWTSSFISFSFCSSARPPSTPFSTVSRTRRSRRTSTISGASRRPRSSCITKSRHVRRAHAAHARRVSPRSPPTYRTTSRSSSGSYRTSSSAPRPPSRLPWTTSRSTRTRSTGRRRIRCLPPPAVVTTTTNIYRRISIRWGKSAVSTRQRRRRQLKSAFRRAPARRWWAISRSYSWAARTTFTTWARSTFRKSSSQSTATACSTRNQQVDATPTFNRSSSSKRIRRRRSRCWRRKRALWRALRLVRWRRRVENFWHFNFVVGRL